MKYTSLGRTGLQVSRLALGAMNFGELTDETLRRLDEIWPGPGGEAP